MPLIKSYLSKTHPYLRSEFLYVLKKNGSKDDKVTFDNITTHSNKRVLWKCPRKMCKNGCEHIYITSPNAKCGKGTGCPYCCLPALKICKCNSLAKLRPDLAQEWDNMRNICNPDEVHLKAGKQIWWKCQQVQCNHHVWKASPLSRVNGNQGCPFCSIPPRQVCSCKNLATEFPNICQEWNHEKNRKLHPEQFASQSNKKVWWQCIKCKHSWESKISNRTSANKQGCPKCRESKLEKQMNNVLAIMKSNQMILTFNTWWRLQPSKMFADFLVILPKGTKIIIEMDGIQHFIPQAFGSSYRSKEDMFAEVQRLDQAKKDWCMSNHVHLLRISYKIAEKDFEAELKDFIAAIERLGQKETLFRLVHKP